MGGKWHRGQGQAGWERQRLSPETRSIQKEKPRAEKCREAEEKAECGQGGGKGCAGLLGQQKKKEAEQDSNKEDNELQLNSSWFVWVQRNQPQEDARMSEFGIMF